MQHYVSSPRTQREEYYQWMISFMQVGTDNCGHVIEKTTRKLLEEKHPKGQEQQPQTLIPDPPESEHHHDAIIFEMITGESFRHAALHKEQLALPVWMHMLSVDYAPHSRMLPTTYVMAAVARRLCTSNVHPDSVMAFVACRLIPLNKNPGVYSTSKNHNKSDTQQLVKTFNQQQDHCRHVPDMRQGVRLLSMLRGPYMLKRTSMQSF